MENFKDHFAAEIKKSRRTDNFSLFNKINNAFQNRSPENLFISRYKVKLGLFLKQIGLRKFTDIEKYFPQLEQVYQKLQTKESKELYVKLLVYRKLGYSKVKLPLCNEDFVNGIQEIRNLADCTESIKPNFLNWELCKFNLSSIGYNISLFFEPASIYIEYILKPYQYKKNGVEVDCKEGDIVIDAGGCWGDTALWFADKVGNNGKVYTFEFIPGNLNIMKKNFSLNNHLQERIEIVEKPVWNESGNKMYFHDFGPASTVSNTHDEKHNIEVSTVTIDEIVKKKNIPVVNFIKMDIEGAEPFALKGAFDTIKKFKPKLAISIYHSLNDFFEIPLLINDLNLGYKFYIDHFTHTSGETVLYATTEL